MPVFEIFYGNEFQNNLFELKRPECFENVCEEKNPSIDKADYFCFTILINKRNQ